MLVQELKKRLERFNGQDVTVVSNGCFSTVIGLEHLMVMDYTQGLQLCNIANILDDGNTVSILVKADNVVGYDVVECCGNTEVHVKWSNGESMMVVGV